MALTDEGGNGGMVMPVAPMGGYGNSGFGGDWGSWIILFLIFGMFNGGWGGFGGGYSGFNAGLGIDFPWLLNGQNGINANVNAGFQNAALNSAIGDLGTAVTAGFGNVQNALCGGFAGVNATVNGAQNAISQQLYTNQISDLERSFAAQTANTQGMNALQGQLAQCCCDNRLATAQTQALVQSENCADRAAIAEGLRDVIVNQTANTQKILDQLCADKIDAKNEKITELQNQVLMRDLAASQNAQTAQIVADNTAQTQYIVNRVAPYPTPSYIVANPNTGCCGNACGTF